MRNNIWHCHGFGNWAVAFHSKPSRTALCSVSFSFFSPFCNMLVMRCLPWCCKKGAYPFPVFYWMWLPEALTVCCVRLGLMGLFCGKVKRWSCTGQRVRYQVTAIQEASRRGIRSWKVHVTTNPIFQPYFHGYCPPSSFIYLFFPSPSLPFPFFFLPVSTSHCSVSLRWDAARRFPRLQFFPSFLSEDLLRYSSSGGVGLL